MVLNNAKIAWREIVQMAIVGEVDPPPYIFTYTIYPASKREFDLGNVCSIVQKFTDDALVELGLLEDDNYKIITEVNYRFGCVDKENPHCELDITRAGEKE
jgi:hypothetical protein